MKLVNPPPAPNGNSSNPITESSFTANWASSTGSTIYRLDFSTAATFASFATGMFVNVGILRILGLGVKRWSCRIGDCVVAVTKLFVYLVQSIAETSFVRPDSHQLTETAISFLDEANLFDDRWAYKLEMECGSDVNLAKTSGGKKGVVWVDKELLLPIVKEIYGIKDTVLEH